jgi:hypothetical protein
MAFLIILAIILLLLFLTSKKKRLLFNPIFRPEMDRWINDCIDNICFKEDLCENCLNYIHCGTKQILENIKNEYENDFIITRCKAFKANSSLKMRKLAKQQEHYNTMVWVNPFTESIREKQCMCINNCRNLDVKNRERNCPAANELYDLCVKCNLAIIMFSCPMWDEIQGPM